MKISRKLTISYLFMTLLVGLVGLFGLKASQEVANSFQGGEKKLRSIVAASTQVSSYAARAEGQLLLYLTLGDPADREGFYSRYASMQRHIGDLDVMVTAPRAVDILSRMKKDAAELLPVAESLINARKGAAVLSKGFEAERNAALLRELSDTTARVRSLGEELSVFVTDFLNRQESITAATELASLAKQAEGRAMLYLALNDQAYRMEFLDRYASLLRRLRDLDGRVEGAEGRKLLGNIALGIDELLPAVQNLFEAHDSEYRLTGFFDFEKHRDEIKGLNEVASLVRANGVELLRLNMAEEAGLAAGAVRYARTVESRIITVLAASIVISLLLGYFISRSVSVPVRRLEDAALEIGKGVLDIELDTKASDEVGSLARSMAMMAAELKNTTVTRDYLDAIHENMLTSLLVLDPEARIQMVNRTACELFGLSAGELEGRALTGLLSGGVIIEKSFAVDLIDKGLLRNVERECVGPGGVSVPVLLSASVMRNASGHVEHIVVVLNDISERKKALREKEIIKAQLDQAQKMEAMGQLTGGIAHDFNNMLTVIAMLADNLAMKTSDERIVTKVTRIRNMTDKATALTQRLLTFSRKGAAEFKPVDLNSLVRNSEKFLARVIGEDIEFCVDTSEGGLPITADSGQIDQILMNLASNARDAMPGGGTLTFRTMRAHIGEEFISANGFGEPGAYACIEVRDTGTGMDKKTAQSVFEPFFTTKDADRGTGLGLSVVYGIVKQHKGYVIVESSPGAGAAFKAYFPMSKHALKLDEPREAEPVHHGTETVLVAEDDAELRGLTAGALEELGYRVIEASDGTEAVARYFENEDAISLLVLDVVMPRMSGKEAYDEILKRAPRARALFFSGYTMDIVNSKGVPIDGEHFLAKPLSVASLSKRIREVIDA